MNRKNIISAVVFLLLVVITAAVVLKGNDIGMVAETLRKLKPVYLLAAAATALFFTSAEGIMICYLLKSLEGGKTKLLSCLKYSFVGFFYSGITPSATGGQPMQLYYMQKDGHKVADSTVVLMTVAVIYKFVLVLIGIGMLLFYFGPLSYYLGKFIYLYYFGLILNGGLVLILLFVMVSPRCFKGIVLGGERLLKRLRILKASDSRTKGLVSMADQYHEAVRFLIGHKHKILWVIAFTFLQRCSVFFLTWLVYRGMGLSGQSMLSIMVLQAAVYIAVDMLPLPGAQGITELMYKAAYAKVFPGAFLTASMCVTRGMNFYFLLLVSACFAVFCYFRAMKV